MIFSLSRSPKLRDLLRVADQARDRKDWPQAALGYRAALGRAADRAGLWVQYGHALKESGYITDAELAYRQAIARDPADADSYVQLGHALKLLQRRDEAREAYRHAFQIDRSSEQARLELTNLDVDPATL
ncbi:tetratricopeptide repeat protein [Tanticharoenia sakaeratensis]|jgi:tetratricopeptide (TPR) repeat protein|uniref:Uncharacterized protein n=1 Tax=Tanticharoenia sakaeratensis NBRC 103193 TaxID=1231623 RepID=A0A0D6MN26_9PROT|nr:tetratricopeptide repeat protein [Tanticharoenia sakaeratensis]GAN54795.1 hypothetical protein Tasa_031_013 [Tanticharoenia sakaeratensis NBRC 103193]GBQ21533.1 hypothetical protein AA103193_1760 [Tanticharoenia sakaeratensis NBRC 103193]